MNFRLECRLFLLTAIQVFLFVTGSAEKKILCAYQGNNSCNDCSENFTDISNINYPNGNFILQVCSKTFSINSGVTIENKQVVVFTGLPSEIRCNYPDFGVQMRNISKLVVKNIALISCGASISVNVETKTDSISSLNTGMYVVYCSDVTIIKVNVTASHGNGLTMISNTGKVSLSKCLFERNENISENLSNSGLHIQISRDDLRQALPTQYSVVNCKFINNGLVAHKRPQAKHTYGGGVYLICTNFSNVLFTIKNSNFTQNRAVRGGALFALFKENSTNNSLLLQGLKFQDNAAIETGGAINVGLVFSPEKIPANIMIEFTNCSFRSNHAEYGGGVSFFSDSSTLAFNKLTFRNCQWTNNTAHFAAAVGLTPRYSSMFLQNLTDYITVQDCSFVSNSIVNVGAKKNLVSYVKGKGTFITVGYNIRFQGKIVFISNNGSAIYLSSSRLEFARGTTANFISNSGLNGGAVYLLGYSALTLHSDVIVSFKNNKAVQNGGAIYQLNGDPTYAMLSENCFIAYIGNKPKKRRNVTVIFYNNTSHNSLSGNSIYATTLVPCLKWCEYEAECIGKFNGDTNNNNMATNGKLTKLSRISESPWELVPGQRVTLPVTTFDDFNHAIDSKYYLIVKNSSSVTLFNNQDEGYAINQTLVFFGGPDDTATLQVETITAKKVRFNIPIKILPCPPGSTFKTNLKMCICMEREYPSFKDIISKCTEDLNIQLTLNYWMGYDEEHLDKECFGSEEFLLFSHCPHSQCYKRDDNDTLPFLPRTTSAEELSNVICGETRKGRLCSKCKSGFVVRYRAINSCGKDNGTCSWGLWLYVLTELFPVTVFFYILVVFDLQLTNGAMNGFIFFAQISSAWLPGGNGHIPLRKSYLVLFKIQYALARVWNLGFFEIDELAFCLWKQAQTLDLLAFRYLTIFYSLFLILLLVVFMKYCHIRKLNTLLIKLNIRKPKSTKNAIIHGISGFLILCYSECTEISLKILNMVKVYNQTGDMQYLVPFHGGHYQYFEGGHQYYAFPALLILVTFGIVPVILFTSYPLCYRVFSLLKIGESRLIALMCTFLPLEKFRPFFDSFQCAFKEQYRYFSGLFFLHRLIYLLILAYADQTRYLFAYVEFQFIIILAIHAVCQPYKNKWHNYIDTLLITNLIIINTISLLNYYHTINLANAKLYLHVLTSFQITFLYLPFAYITCYIGKHVIAKLRNLKPSAEIGANSDYHEMTISLPLNVAEDR